MKVCFGEELTMIPSDHRSDRSDWIEGDGTMNATITTLIVTALLVSGTVFGCRKSPEQTDTAETPKAEAVRSQADEPEAKVDPPDAPAKQRTTKPNANEEKKQDITTAGTIPGKYHNQHDYGEYLDFRADGALYWRQDARGLRIADTYEEKACKWSMDGNEIMIVGPQGKVTRGTTQTSGISVSGKLWIRHEEIVQKDKVISDTIPGTYVLRVESDGTNRMTSNALVFSEDGKVIELVNGTWTMRNDRVKFYQGHERVGDSDIVDDTSLGGVSKQEDAERLIERQLDIALWSDYVSLEQFTPMGSVRFDKDGTYLGRTFKSTTLNPYLATLRNVNYGHSTFGGEWEVRGDKVTLNESSRRFLGRDSELQEAQVTRDSIDGLTVLTRVDRGVSTYAIPRLVKTIGAWPLAEVKSSGTILWSRYVPSEGGAESEVVKFKKDGTFECASINADGNEVQNTGFAGKWTRRAADIDFRDIRATDSMEYHNSSLGNGSVRATSIMIHNWGTQARYFVKRNGASVIGRESRKVTLWNSYGSDLQLRTDGTFSRKNAIGTWKVENEYIVIDVKFPSERHPSNLECRLSGDNNVAFGMEVGNSTCRFTRQQAAGPVGSSAANSQDSAESTSEVHLEHILAACVEYGAKHYQFPPSLQTLVTLNYLPAATIESPRKPKDFDGPSYVYIPGYEPDVTGENVIAYENPAFLSGQEPIPVGLFTRTEDTIRQDTIEYSVEAMSRQDFLHILEATYYHFHAEMPQATTLGLPEPNYHVRDYGRIVDKKDAQAMNEILAQLELAAGICYHVFVVDTAGGVPIEQFSGECAKKWHLNENTHEKWLLFVIAVDDKQYHFEVGSGMREFVPLCTQVAKDILEPTFKKSSYGEGIYKASTEVARGIANKQGVTLSERP